MENKKDIGRLFREKLNDLDKTPNDAVWNAINADLEKKKRRRFVFFFLTAAAGILIILLGILTSKNYFSADKKESMPNQKEVPAVVLSDAESQGNIQTDTVFKNKKVTKSKATTTKKLIKYTDEVEEYEVVTKYKIYVKKSKSTTITTAKTAASKAKNGTVNKSSKTVNPAIKPAAGFKFKKVTAKSRGKAGQSAAKSVVAKKPITAKNYKPKKKKTIATTKKSNKSGQIASKANPEKPFIPKENVVAFQGADTTSSKEVPVIKKDSVASLVLKDAETKKDTLRKKREYKPQKPPVEEKEFQTYVSVFVGPTYYDSFSKSSGLIKSGDNFDKKGNVRLSFGFYGRAMFNDKIGIRLGFIETAVGYTTTLFPNDNGFYQLNNVYVQNNTATTNFNTHFEGSDEVRLRQNNSYFEIPAEFYYVFDSEAKIGIDGFAGFSTYFLHKSEILAKADGKSDLLLGEASNTKAAFFGWNLGMVFNYKLYKNWKIDVSPLLKYQVKPFSNATDFKPLTYSIQFGLTCQL